MQLLDELTDRNFELYAAKHYNNPRCIDIQEFYDDLSKFKYLKRLFGRYKEKKELQERLILNHLITIHNIFYIEAARTMCFHRIDEAMWPALKTFLLYLNYLPEDEYVDIPVDLFVVKKLQSI